jgi:hypothetical protein
MTVVNIPGDSVEKGDAIIEYSPKYEHDQAAGVQRVVALVYEQKEKIDTSAMVKFDKVRKKERKKESQSKLYFCVITVGIGRSFENRSFENSS